jgi:hypothetical protein
LGGAAALEAEEKVATILDTRLFLVICRTYKRNITVFSRTCHWAAPVTGATNDHGRGLLKLSPNAIITLSEER